MKKVHIVFEGVVVNTAIFAEDATLNAEGTKVEWSGGEWAAPSGHRLVIDEDAQIGWMATADGLRAPPASTKNPYAGMELPDVKAALKSAVDHVAEQQRLRFITAGAGQAMTYAQKAEEAGLCLDAAGPDPEDYPLLAAEIGITANTLVGVAQVVATANAQWLQIGAAIEAARLSAKKAISEAETVEDAQAAADAIVWP